MCLYLGMGWLHTPMFVHPLYICTPPIHSYAPQGCTHPLGAPMLLCSCMVLAHCMLWGGCFFCFMCIGTHHPYLGMSPPYLHPPHSIVGSLCIVILRDISSYVGLSPSIEGFGAVPPITGEVGVTHQQLFTCSFCYTFFL